jgi:hypothetical protein
LELKTSTHNNLIFLVADTSILNPKETVAYENLSQSYSVFLNTMLFTNWVEVLSDIQEDYQIITFLHESDKEYLPKYLFQSHIENKFYTSDQLLDFSNSLSNYNTDVNTKSLILFSNSIGLNKSDILRVFNLVQSDEPTIIIGKSNQDKIGFSCTSANNIKLFDSIFLSERNYSKYLQSISIEDIFILTLNNFLLINDFQDIKKLYIELSKKESLAYCSPKMHESFNDLFIEYKDLLNV